MALNGAWQVYRLTRKLKSTQLNVPLFFSISAQDEIVSFNAALKFFKAQKHPDNQCLVFSSQTFKTTKQIHCIASAIPEKHILSLSHLGILYSPNNLHYGEKGDYTKLNKQRYPADYYGSVLTVEKQKDGKRISRLLYNPFFSILTSWL